MSGSKRRLDKVELSLTPQQAVLAWLQEAHRHDTMEEYCHWLQTQPDSAWPLVKLPAQVTAAVEKATRGWDREAVRQARRQAVRDLLFQFHLVMQVNR